jgi:hypothetical protein
MTMSSGYDHKPDISELAHYGVKGMKWGVHRTMSRSGRDIRKAVKTGDMSRRQATWEKDVFTSKNYIKAYNRGAANINSKIPEFNRKHPLTEKSSKAQMKAYNKAVNKMMADTFTETFRSMFGDSPDGRRLTVNEEDMEETGWPIIELQHSGIGLPTGVPKIKVIFDEIGRIVSVELDESELSHYGIKGMKWGVRKDRSSRRAARATKVRKALGVDSEESRQVLSTMTKRVGNMSNSELQAAVNRMNLERKYERLANPKKEAAKNMAEKIFQTLGPTVLRFAMDQVFGGRRTSDRSGQEETVIPLDHMKYLTSGN